MALSGGLPQCNNSGVIGGERRLVMGFLGPSRMTHRDMQRLLFISSARIMRANGTSGPSAFAVLRLMTGSNLAGARTGSAMAPSR
jgi:hypothetical protein